MAISIEEKLKELAQRYYISVKSSEQPKIKASLESIKKKLRHDFDDRIASIEVFGSYARKTILPRNYDRKSDIDLLIVFDHESINVNPSTYRKHLLDFAESYYPNSISYKSKPSVVLELNHINYDLVPAYRKDTGWIFENIRTYIPSSDTHWMETDIIGFSEKLEDVNKRYDFNVKRIIRLLKAWNANVNYPIKSYSLEREIASMNFSGDDIEEGFFYAIDNLSDERNSSVAEDKIESLKENAENLREALEEEDEDDIKKYLKRILPI